MAEQDDGALLPLRDAVERFRAEPGAHSNAYGWWRKYAQLDGRTTFGRSRQLVRGATNSVPVRKLGNRWMVEAAAFNAALAEHRAAMAELRYITDEYDQRHLLVGVGGGLQTSWGSYWVSKDFHLHRNRYVQPWRGNGEWWICNSCWEAASLEHDNPECHSCSDWVGAVAIAPSAP